MLIYNYKYSFITSYVSSWAPEAPYHVTKVINLLAAPARNPLKPTETHWTPPKPTKAHQSPPKAAKAHQKSAIVFMQAALHIQLKARVKPKAHSVSMAGKPVQFLGRKYSTAKDTISLYTTSWGFY